MITAYPIMRIYRNGTNDVIVRGRHKHEAYESKDRTEEALNVFIDQLVEQTGSAHTRMADTRQLTVGEACMVCPSSALTSGVSPELG